MKLTAVRALRSYRLCKPWYGLAAATILATCGDFPLRAEPVQPKPWFKRCVVGMEVGPTGAQFGHSDPHDKRYAAKFDGREIVRHCVDAHSEYLVIWARDGDYAYYNSKLLPKAPGLEKRDPLREAVDEAHRQKLPLIAYCVVQQGGHFLHDHPELEMRDAEGRSIGRFCFNSGYLDIMKQLVTEQLAYRIDGFHIDMLDQGFRAAVWVLVRALSQEVRGRVSAVHAEGDHLG